MNAMNGIGSTNSSDDMNSKETSVSLSELIESRNLNLNDIRLTIYYMSFSALTPIPVSLDMLIGGWHDNTGQLMSGGYDYKIIVPGRNLAEPLNSLNYLINAELIPVENESSRVEARLYYVIEHKEYGEIFSFLAFGGGGTMFVNGLEIEHNSVFLEVVLPFMPADAASAIERSLHP